MKKIFFSFMAICTVSTFAFANKNPKIIDENRKEVLMEKNYGELTISKFESIQEKSISQNSDEKVHFGTCDWVYIAWFVELNANEGFSVAEAHSFASGLESMCKMGNAVWP
nr:hypothetical protein [uncultured Flavobacterium sp.]